MGTFDHTYPERFWPKMANEGTQRPNGRQVFVPHQGIRFEYGDLSDVIALLVRDRHTRQAYLPIWFPEDTGPESHQRVPCTLGYHFMIRNGALTMRYYLRSCDVYRHMRNDMYFAARLGLYISDAVTEESGFTVRPGRLLTHISSLHMFVNDERHIRHQAGTNHQDHGTAQFPASCESCRMETTALGTVTINGL
jgi:thymidylate synthase